MNIADKAKDVVFGDRQLNYGKPERNQALIAELWSAYTGADISAHDVCMMMAILKIARLKNSPGHDDSRVDLIGYALLDDEIVNPKNESEQNLS